MGSFDMRTRETFTFDNDNNRFLKYGSDYVLRSKLTELFLAEHALRELIQREEWLHHKVIALKKAMVIESNENSDTTEFDNANKQLK